MLPYLISAQRNTTCPLHHLVGLELWLLKSRFLYRGGNEVGHQTKRLVTCPHRDPIDLVLLAQASPEGMAARREGGAAGKAHTSGERFPGPGSQESLSVSLSLSAVCHRPNQSFKETSFDTAELVHSFSSRCSCPSA